MNKLVNIHASIPVRDVTPPIYGEVMRCTMSTDDIFKCICHRALVDEVLSDGSIVRLGLNNYNKVNEVTPLTDIEIDNGKSDEDKKEVKTPKADSKSDEGKKEAATPKADSKSEAVKAEAKESDEDYEDYNFGQDDTVVGAATVAPTNTTNKTQTYKKK